MASYDNKHWLLSHIKNSFIFSDDTGLCEVAMGGENIAHHLKLSQYECYPGVEESDEEDEMDLSQSYDLHADYDFGRPRRYRSNTAVRLQKMNEERMIAANTRYVHWSKCPLTLTADEKAELFRRKDFRSTNSANSKPHSLLSEMIKNDPDLPANPFREYARFDGESQPESNVRYFKIWLTILKNDKRNFPMKVTVMASARVLDLIGLICWRCMCEYSFDETGLKDSLDYYTLHIAEDDGEVDWDFPCLDTRESVTKFTFNFLALVENDPKKEPPDRHATRQVVHMPSEQTPSKSRARDSEPLDDKKQYRDIDARIRAPIYESFKVYIVNKVRSKTEVHLGVSGEKVEIDPVLQTRVSALFGRHKASTHDMDSIVACDLIETKSNQRASFRLVHTHAPLSASLGTSTSTTSYKHLDFETTTEVANLIVQKINHIFEVKPSTKRKEYIAHREHKSHRRKSFHIGPR